MSILTPELRERILAYASQYPDKRAATLPALHAVHDELQCVPHAAIVEIAELLELHPAEVHDTMSFYEFFKGEGEKLGRTRLWICRGLACMLRGAYDLIAQAEQRLGVRCGQTTPDEAITLEFAECIGACDGAPACLKNDVHVMNLNPQRLDELLEQLRQVQSAASG